MRPASQGSAGVVIPLRSFADAKARLADVLDAPARAELARSMAERVVEAARAYPAVIVSSASDVIAWAGADVPVIADPGTLDAAADAGRQWVRDRGLARVVVVHADLPHILSLDAVTGDGEQIAVVVPDHRGDGNPVLSLPAAAPFRFAYGPGSSRRHIAEAERCGLAVRVVHDSGLSFDVDIAEDLARLTPREPSR